MYKVSISIFGNDENEGYMHGILLELRNEQVIITKKGIKFCDI